MILLVWVQLSDAVDHGQHLGKDKIVFTIYNVIVVK
jgi:hypothetical protein